jgi:hypothetical protein
MPVTRYPGQSRIFVNSLSVNPAEFNPLFHIPAQSRFIKKRIAASLWFRSAEGASRTIDGYEAMHLIRKGQIRWLPKSDVVGQRRFIHTLFGIAA